MDRNYIYIFEDGGIFLSSEFQDEDRKAVDDGILTVIDCGDSEPKEYYLNKWNDLDRLTNPDE